MEKEKEKEETTTICSNLNCRKIMSNKAELIVVTGVLISEQMEGLDREKLLDFQTEVAAKYGDAVANNLVTGVLEIMTGINQVNDDQVQLQT